MSRRLIAALALSLSAVLLHAQAKEEQRDSVVLLLKAQAAQAVDIEGQSYRKVIGPATFLHNNTYLLCDTAYWNVDAKIINAVGHVQIEQQETVLSSDRLIYLVDQDLAQFRGSLVQLEDKDHNTLRTHNLDYNTKDSLAIFFNGASMRDKDGQIIESINGTYDSPAKRFTFTDSVNMFTDSIFVKTAHLVYESEKNFATFDQGTALWKEDNMLSSWSGWYDRARETFFFTDNVHVLSRDQEGWADSLYFYRNRNDIDMLGNAQLSDTTRNVHALAGKITYVDSISRVTLLRDPAVVTMVKERVMQPDSTYKEEPDTVYMGADYLSYFTIPKYKVDSLTVAEAAGRKSVIEFDPVTQFRRKAAEEAAKAAEEARRNDPNFLSQEMARKSQEAEKQAIEDVEDPEDSLTLSGTDSLTLERMGADSLATDTLSVPVDTTDIGFLEALHNVKIYRKSMQVVCDSLLYCDLDSLARLFKDPVVFQEGTRQYSADSISIVVRNEAMDRASLMSNAFIALEQDSLHHNQIKSTEMMAYFSPEGNLQRFDALGGAQALFYMEENDTLATVNKKDSKMLSARFKDGDIERVYYFDAPKSDAYPVAQMTPEERRLKGFSWQPDRRPADRFAITALELRAGERSRYERIPKAQFINTEKYFQGYMGNIYRQIEVRDSLKVVRERERVLAEREQARRDSLARLDSLALRDSLALSDSLRIADSLAVAKDSLALADSLKDAEASVALPDSIVKTMTAKERKAYRKEQARLKKEARKKKKQELREAKWKEMDAKDEARRKAREEKKKEKERAMKRKALREIAEQERKDRELYEHYLRKYQKQAERDRLKAERKAKRDGEQEKPSEAEK